MRRASVLSSHSADYVFIAYASAIILFGLLVLSSAGVAVGIDRHNNDAYFFIKEQLLKGFFPGIIAFFIMSKIDYSVWRKYALPIFVFSILLLILVFIPGIGSTNKTFAHSWIKFSFANFSFQPIEIVKLGIIMYLAAVLASIGNSIKEVRGFVSILGVSTIPLVLVVLQPDIGGMFILGALIILMLFFARAKLTHLMILFLLGILAFGIMFFVASKSADQNNESKSNGRINDRIVTFLHPEYDPGGKGYQINQAFLAIGTGGWFGLGFGHSRQKFQYLPEVQADSIFAIASEELGFVIMVLCIGAYMLLFFRGTSIAEHSPDEFGRLLVLGIMSWFGVQTLMNIGAMVGLVPLTGVPLPFISHGGTALMVSMASLGVVVNVSKQTKHDSRHMEQHTR